MKTGLKNRLVGHFALCAVAATSMVAANSANGQVVYHELNQVIPADIDGLYINIVSGTTGFSSGVGTPFINFYGESTGIISVFGSANVRTVNNTFWPGETGNLPFGFEVGADIPNTGPEGTPRWNVGTGPFFFGVGETGVFNARNYVGFQFQFEGNTHYGYAAIDVGANAATRSLWAIAFDATPGASIAVGAIPAPGAIALLGVAGLVGSRRRRA